LTAGAGVGKVTVTVVAAFDTIWVTEVEEEGKLAVAMKFVSFA